MAASRLRRPAQHVLHRAASAGPRWRRREVVVSAMVAVTSALMLYLAWHEPMSVAERLMTSAVALGGLAGACAPRLLFLPSAFSDVRNGVLAIPRVALQLAQLGRWLLLAALGCWLGNL